MSRKKRSALIIITLVFLIPIGYFFFVLQNKSYLVSNSRLHDLGVVTILNRGEKISSGGKSHSYTIRFRDESWNEYEISGARLSALTNESEVFDSLQNPELVLQVKTDDKGYVNFRDEKKGNVIQVWGISINGKEYLDLERINENKSKGLKHNLWFWTFVYVIAILFLFFGGKRKQEGP